MNASRLGIIVAVLIVVAVYGARADSVIRFETIATGGLAVTGNTLGLAKALNSNGPGTSDSIGTFITVNTSLLDDTPSYTPSWPAGTTSTWTLNSSAAYLDIPAGSDVLHAELIWGGSYDYFDDVSSSLDTPVTLSFQDGSSASVPPATETALTISQVATSGMYTANYYVRSAEVTSFVAGRKGGRYTVAGVPATQFETVNSLNAAGWALVVAYANTDEPTRKLAIRVCCDFIDAGLSADYAFDGFQTRSTGDVVGSVIASAIEGDASRTGDRLNVLRGTAIALSTSNNPVENFFASQINSVSGLIDERGTFGTVNHDATSGVNTSGGRQGWDVTGVALSGTHLDNSQSSVTFRADSSADEYLPVLIGFQVEVDAPRFVIDSSSYTASPTLLNAGDTVTFSVILDNTLGDLDAVDCVFTHAVPDDLVVTAFAIGGVAGDKDHHPVTTLALNAGVPIGNVPKGTSVTLTYSAKADAVPSPSSFSRGRRGSTDSHPVRRRRWRKSPAVPAFWR